MSCWLLVSLQVLMWRTNFDTKCYQEVLQQHSRRSTPDPPPHLCDIHPKSPHLHRSQSSTIKVRPNIRVVSTRSTHPSSILHLTVWTLCLSPQISPTVADTQSADPRVIELGQAVHSTMVRQDTKSTLKSISQSFWLQQLNRKEKIRG